MTAPTASATARSGHLTDLASLLVLASVLMGALLVSRLSATTSDRQSVV